MKFVRYMSDPEVEQGWQEFQQFSCQEMQMISPRILHRQPSDFPYVVFIIVCQLFPHLFD